MAEITLENVQALLYAVITILSIGVFGFVGELCDRTPGDCPDRQIVVIVFAVFVFVLALPMFVAYAFDISFLLRIEIFVVLAMVAFNAVEVGVASSPRTSPIFNIGVELAWWSMLATLAALFLSLVAGDRPKFEVSLKRSDPEAAAEEPLAAGQDGSAVSSQPGQTTPATYTSPPDTTQ